MAQGRTTARRNSWSDDSGEEEGPDFGEYEEIILNKRQQQLPPDQLEDAPQDGMTDTDVRKRNTKGLDDNVDDKQSQNNQQPRQRNVNQPKDDQSSNDEEYDSEEYDSDPIWRRHQRQEEERERLKRNTRYQREERRERRNQRADRDEDEAPSDHLIWSIISSLTIPDIGVVALIFSGLSIKSRIQGNIDEAKAYGDVAQKLNWAVVIISVGIFLLSWWVIDTFEQQQQVAMYNRHQAISAAEQQRAFQMLLGAQGRQRYGR